MIPQPPAPGLSWITNSLIFHEHVIIRTCQKEGDFSLMLKKSLNLELLNLTLAVLTLLGRRVAVGEEAEVALVVPADQRQAALHHDPPLAALRRRGAADQHVLGEARAVALPGAQQAAAVDVWRQEGKGQHRCQNESNLFEQNFSFVTNMNV